MSHASSGKRHVSTSVMFEGRHFCLRQLREAKIKPVLEVMWPQNLTGYATACGWALARAHERSGDAVADFAMVYAERNEQDHAALVAAIRAGRLEARLD